MAVGIAPPLSMRFKVASPASAKLLPLLIRAPVQYELSEEELKRTYPSLEEMARISSSCQGCVSRTAVSQKLFERNSTLLRHECSLSWCPVENSSEVANSDTVTVEANVKSWNYLRPSPVDFTLDGVTKKVAIESSSVVVVELELHSNDSNSEALHRMLSYLSNGGHRASLSIDAPTITRPEQQPVKDAPKTVGAGDW